MRDAESRFRRLACADLEVTGLRGEIAMSHAQPIRAGLETVTNKAVILPGLGGALVAQKNE